MQDKSILLDTHAWIWMALGNDKMSKGPARKLIDRAYQAGALAISSISLWELSMLESKGRIVLAQPCLDWIQESLSRLRLEVIQMSAEIAVESSRLPGGFHGDPADRIIVATARKNNMVLVTQDELILSYAKSGLLNAKSCF